MPRNHLSQSITSERVILARTGVGFSAHFTLNIIGAGLELSTPCVLPTHVAPSFQVLKNCCGALVSVDAHGVQNTNVSLGRDSARRLLGHFSIPHLLGHLFAPRLSVRFFSPRKARRPPL